MGPGRPALGPERQPRFGLPDAVIVLNQIKLSRAPADQHRIALVVDVLVRVELIERPELLTARSTAIRGSVDLTDAGHTQIIQQRTTP